MNFAGLAAFADIPSWLLRSIQDEWPTRDCGFVEPFGEVDEPARMTLEEFEKLGEYSTTLPSGVVLWKKWKRCFRSRVAWLGPPKWQETWWLGTYTPGDGSRDRTGADIVGIRWQRIEITDR